MAIFYPFGHPIPYAYGSKALEGGRREQGTAKQNLSKTGLNLDGVLYAMPNSNHSMPCSQPSLDRLLGRSRDGPLYGAITI
jgi:hypothetical protein